MQILSILVGIGLMLVASLAYALPLTHEFAALYPAFAGIIIATVGFVCQRHERFTKYLIYMNGMAAAMIMVWACLRAASDTLSSSHESLMLVADWDTICLCGILIHRVAKEMISAMSLDKQEEDALRNLEGK